MPEDKYEWSDLSEKETDQIKKFIQEWYPDHSPICAELDELWKYGICSWCEKQAKLHYHFYHGPDLFYGRTEIEWRCKCGKSWPVLPQDICAVMKEKTVNTWYHERDGKISKHQVWYPTCTNDNPNERREFSEEVRQDEKEWQTGKRK